MRIQETGSVARYAAGDAAGADSKRHMQRQSVIKRLESARAPHGWNVQLTVLRRQ